MWRQGRFDDDSNLTIFQIWNWNLRWEIQKLCCAFIFNRKDIDDAHYCTNNINVNEMLRHIYGMYESVRPVLDIEQLSQTFFFN